MGPLVQNHWIWGVPDLGVGIQGGPDPGGPDPGGPKWGRFWGHFEGPKQLEISSIRGVPHVVAHV